jgi:hypothetical protein
MSRPECSFGRSHFSIDATGHKHFMELLALLQTRSSCRSPYDFNFRRSYLGVSKVCTRVCLSPRLSTHFSTDLDETLEIDLEYYHTTFSKSKEKFEHFYVFITVP